MQLGQNTGFDEMLPSPPSLQPFNHLPGPVCLTFFFQSSPLAPTFFLKRTAKPYRSLRPSSCQLLGGSVSTPPTFPPRFQTPL